MPEITLTPLIDSALTLLVIFMITAPMVQYGIRVDLPVNKSKEMNMQQEMVVTLNKDGKLYFNSYPVDKNTLIDSVKKEMGRRDDLPVYVRADKTVAYGQVVEIIDFLKQAGVRFVAMSTRSMA
jgi:biopolymer transport protein ExbD